MKTIVNF